MLSQGPDGRPVGVPLLALAEVVAVDVLSGRIGAQDLGRLGVQAVPVHGREHVGRVAEPEPVVGGRAGRDIGTVVEQEHVPAVGLHGVGEGRVGQIELEPAPGLRLPRPRH